MPEPLPEPNDRPDPGLVAACRSVRRYLRFLGCTEPALADLTQDTMLAGLARWPAASPPVPWLLATARNLFRRHLRQHRRRRELLDLERLAALWTEQATDGAGEAVQAALAECVAGLPARSRTVLQLRYHDGLERDAIGARVGLSGEGVKSLLARTRAALAECVRRRIGDE
ncbi:MAG: RNA polymerase sigma factor [Planctomycetota bacterium]